jgi:hypothetical protein
MHDDSDYRTPQPQLKYNLDSAIALPCGVTQKMRYLEEEYVSQVSYG